MSRFREKIYCLICENYLVPHITKEYYDSLEEKWVDNAS
jgi:hypothetical protein